MCNCQWSHLSAGECNVTFFACVWQFITGRAQSMISSVTSDSLHCEKNAMKAAIYLMASCGDTAKNGLDKHSNKDKDFLFSTNDARGNGRLRLGNKFYDP